MVRHAKASHSVMGLDDFERPLTSRGKRDALMLGQSLRDAGLRPDLIVSSPARRARKTARRLARALGYARGGVVLDSRLYFQGDAAIVALIHELPEDARQVLLVGHNPDLSALLRHFMILSADLPTCGVERTTFGAPSWRDFAPVGGAIQRFS